MNNQIQVVLKSSTTEMSLNDHHSGIYIVPELNGLTGLPDIRTTSGVNAGYDGGWTSAQNYDARSITIRGVIANEDVAIVEQLRRQLTTLAGQGKSEELTLDLVTQAGKAYTIQVRTIALEMSLQKVLTQQEFMIQLRADDPLIYDNTEAGEPAIVQVQKALGGFQIPFEIPLAIGGGEDAAIIDNHGLEQVAPIVKMYGALHNPKIINQTTNQYMQIEANLGYAEGAYTDAEQSDSGQAISFDAPIAAPLSDFSLKGNTVQNGTPTPSAPVPVQTVTGENVVKICGKNLYSAQKTQTTTGGITYSIENGVMKINGTRTEASNLGVTFPITYKANTTYTCSVRVVSGSLSFDSRWGSQITFGNVGGSKYVTIYDAYAADSKMATVSFTPTADTTTNLAFWFGYESAWTNKSFNNIVVEIQVEANSSATSFEPYQEQSYEVNLGKNLFDGENANAKTGYILNDSGTEVSDNTGGYTRNYSAVRPNTTYTISGMAGAGTRRIYFYNGGKTFLSRTSGYSGAHEITFTTPANCYFVNVQIYTNTDTSSAMASWQLEKGSQATSYAAYFTPIELCKIGAYQDYIYKSGGKWYAHKAVGKIALDGSEAWYNAGGNAPFGLVIDGALITTSDDNPPLVYCDKFYPVSQNASWSSYSSLISTNTITISTNTIRIRYTDMASLGAFQTWLGSNNTTLYYALATPTDTEITNAALIEQLDAILNSGRVYEGTNNITTVIAAGNANGEVQVSYYTHQDPSTRDEIIIDSRLRTITLNGLDIYDKKTEGSDFLMLAPGENKLILQSDIEGDNGYAEVNYKQGYLSI